MTTQEIIGGLIKVLPPCPQCGKQRTSWKTAENLATQRVDVMWICHDYFFRVSIDSGRIIRRGDMNKFASELVPMILQAVPIGTITIPKFSQETEIVVARKDSMDSGEIIIPKKKAMVDFGGAVKQNTLAVQALTRELDELINQTTMRMSGNFLFGGDRIDALLSEIESRCIQSLSGLRQRCARCERSIEVARYRFSWLVDTADARARLLTVECMIGCHGQQDCLMLQYPEEFIASVNRAEQAIVSAFRSYRPFYRDIRLGSPVPESKPKKIQKPNIISEQVRTIDLNG